MWNVDGRCQRVVKNEVEGIVCGRRKDAWCMKKREEICGEDVRDIRSREWIRVWAEYYTFAEPAKRSAKVVSDEEAGI